MLSRAAAYTDADFLVPAQVPKTGPAQGDFCFKGKEIVDAAECVTSLSCRSPFSSSEGSEIGSWSSGSEGCLNSFAMADEMSSEEDLDYFVALDIASVAEARPVEGPSIGAPLPAIRGKRSRVGISKRRLGSSDAAASGRKGGRKRRRMGLSGPESRVSLREVLGMVPLRLCEGGAELVEKSGRVPAAKAFGGVLGHCFGEPELRTLFEGEELDIILYNYREAGLVSKEEPL